MIASSRMTLKATKTHLQTLGVDTVLVAVVRCLAAVAGGQTMTPTDAEMVVERIQIEYAKAKLSGRNLVSSTLGDQASSGSLRSRRHVLIQHNQGTRLAILGMFFWLDLAGHPHGALAGTERQTYALAWVSESAVSLYKAVERTSNENVIAELFRWLP